MQGSAVAGTLAIAGPLQACAGRVANDRGAEGLGYGVLVDQGDLALPKGFKYRVISREGDPMEDGSPTPGRFDGMSAFLGPGGMTVVVRNHENKAEPDEVAVAVPDDMRYDADTRVNGGVTKLLVAPNRSVVESYAVMGGTLNNCAGGQTPWGTWISCEERFFTGDERHGYAFEVDSRARGPVEPLPLKGAGRFVHEAVAWLDGFLYETEDVSDDSAFYRYSPDRRPRVAGDLAAAQGELHALALAGEPEATMRQGWPVGKALPVEWVKLDEPDPDDDSLRLQAAGKGAAAFDRQEGVWAHDGRIYFACTEAGEAACGQIWEYNPARETLTLIYESPGPEELKNPDNLVVAPRGTLFVCEDSPPPQFIRGITTRGEAFDFAQATGIDSEFAGACFDPDGATMFVNQQGAAGIQPSVTYAIWGPW